jgi:3-oxoacyl-[acyl-carrier protein] reductase
MSKKKDVIWITGASSGIGRAAAREFVKTGCKVYVSARRVTELERLKKELQKENLDAQIIPCNVASYQNVDQAAKRILSENSIDCLINNAGITSFKLAEENSINEIDDLIKTNLLGSIYTIKSVLPDMIERKSGTIININSIITQKFFKRSSAYAASKMGMLGYSKVLREEVREYNIRIIDVFPGNTKTSMWSQEVRKQNSKRMMSPKDIAQVIVWSYLQEGNMVSEEIYLKPIKGDL